MKKTYELVSEVYSQNSEITISKKFAHKKEVYFERWCDSRKYTQTLKS